MFTGIVEEIGTLRQVEPTGLVIVERTFNDFGFNDFGFNDGFDNDGFDNGGFFFPQDENFQFSDFGSNFFFDQNQFGFFNGEDQFEGQFFIRVHVILICRRHHEERFFDFQD